MAGLGRTDVVALLCERLAAVLGLGPDEVTEESRFDEDLHADSLDLVEVIEAIERQLAQRDLSVTLPEDELLGTRTVAEAADRIMVHAGQG